METINVFSLSLLFFYMNSDNSIFNIFVEKKLKTKHTMSLYTQLNKQTLNQFLIKEMFTFSLISNHTNKKYSYIISK